jgi:hypothetical protein
VRASLLLPFLALDSRTRDEVQTSSGTSSFGNGRSGPVIDVVRATAEAPPFGNDPRATMSVALPTPSVLAASGLVRSPASMARTTRYQTKRHSPGRRPLPLAELVDCLSGDPERYRENGP